MLENRFVFRRINFLNLRIRLNETSSSKLQNKVYSLCAIEMCLSRFIYLKPKVSTLLAKTPGLSPTMSCLSLPINRSSCENHLQLLIHKPNKYKMEHFNLKTSNSNVSLSNFYFYSHTHTHTDNITLYIMHINTNEHYLGFAQYLCIYFVVSTFSSYIIQTYITLSNSLPLVLLLSYSVNI